MSYQLSIITPNGKVFDNEVESLTASGKSGSFGILGKHAPLVASLESGPLKINEGAKEHYFAVSSGVLEVNNQSNVLVLTDNAVLTDSYDRAKSTAKDFDA